MDERNYQNLRVLEEVDRSSRVTTRFAASKLGISVKLAHSVLTGLIKRGLVQVSARDGRSRNYLLTPAGAREKIRLTYQYLDFSRYFFKEARRRSSQACARLARAGVDGVAFLGCGELAEIAYLGVQEQALTLAAVYDDDRVGRTFMGLKVAPCSSLPSVELPAEEQSFSRILVTAYDINNPTKGPYLPGGVTADERFVWVFDDSGGS